jgi:type II secretory pathway pseudopilin PulG
MCRTPSSKRTAESGFTLAGLIVIMTVIAVVIAYTIPRQWSIATARDRDLQTLFAMKQYARAIQAFQDKNKAQPVSLDQLKQARNPRFIRGTTGEFIDPLTSKVDWVPIPMTNQTAQQAQQPGGAPVAGIIPNQRNQVVPVMPPVTSPTPLPDQTGTAAGQPGNFAGPIMGVRPNKTGKSYLMVNSSDTYEQWSYTTVDLQNEIAQHRNAIMIK